MERYTWGNKINLYQATGRCGHYQYRIISAEAGNINSSSCRVASNVITVTENARPVTSATNNGPQCDGTAVTLTAGGGLSYVWTYPDKHTEPLQSIIVNQIKKIQVNIS